MSRPKDWSPLRDSDPTPGDPYEVAELGRKLRSMADMIDQQARNIDALSSVEGWDSDAGRAFHEVAGGAAGRLKKAFKRYDEAAKAVGASVKDDGSREFASELHRAQRKADQGLKDYQHAHADYAEAEREIKKITDKHHGQVPHDELTEYRRWVHKRQDASDRMGKASRAVRDAEDIFNDAGNHAARHIKDVVYHDAVHDPGGFMNFLADWADNFSNISAVLGVLAVICAIVPPLQALEALVVALTVLTSALALAGHIYDMTARGGKFDALKLGVDVLGVVPGFGALKGIKAVEGAEDVGAMARLGAKGLGALRGIDHSFMNGTGVKVVNAVVKAGAKRLGKTVEPIEGKYITSAIKGGSFAHKVAKYVMGHHDGGTRTAPAPRPATTPTPHATTPGTSSTPTPAPAASPKPFHAAVAA